MDYPERPQLKPKWLARGAIRRSGIYVLPNAITTVALFAGFYAIVQAMNNRFELAAMAVFVAMVFDGLDGRVARLTRTQSPFGAEYDSLSDMVSFGAAPALVIYEWALKGMGRMGWVAAFVYCACAALRLARFNTNLAVVDKRFFQGLPSPAAAGLIAGLVWTMESFDYEPQRVYEMRWVAWTLTMFAGLSMVSSIRFYSGKDINLRRSVPFSVVVLLVLIVVVLYQVADNVPEVLFGVFLIYAGSGYVMLIGQHLRRKKPPPTPPPALPGTS
ncbi:MAG TPA: CDP-diacylglycerol--serine O-phosphatidyltransferase [Burkholderiales bacterium]|nr:CDP-diacylglycerol--serine O-phosphatidyltransferase [Burkholderiales bacterium]